MNFKHSYLVFAIGAALAAPAVFAAGDYGAVDVEADVALKKDFDVYKDVKVEVELENKHVDVASMSTVADSQKTGGIVYSDGYDSNDAELGYDAFKDVTGVVGVNAAAGNNNAQDNSVAISATLSDGKIAPGLANDCSKDCDGKGKDKGQTSLADAEVVVDQAGGGVVDVLSEENSAELGGSFMRNAEGILGVNVAAGNANLQKNNAAVAYSATDAVLAEATIVSGQSTSTEVGVFEKSHNAAKIGYGVMEHATGIIGVNVASGAGNAQSNSVAIAAAGSPPAF